MCASLLNAGTPPPPSLSPQTWPVRLFICDAEGRDKAVARPGGEQVQVVETDVVGPLCFQVCEECREGRGHAQPDHRGTDTVAATIATYKDTDTDAGTDAGRLTISASVRLGNVCVPSWAQSGQLRILNFFISNSHFLWMEWPQDVTSLQNMTGIVPSLGSQHSGHFQTEASSL